LQKSVVVFGKCIANHVIVVWSWQFQPTHIAFLPSWIRLDFLAELIRPNA